MSNIAYANYLNAINRQFNNYYTIAAVTIGVPCNLACLFIFWRLLKNKTNMGLLGIIQTVVDLFILLMFLFVFRAWQLFYPISPLNRDDFQCRFFTLIRRFMLHVSSWVAVISTFDRFTYVFYGHDQRLKFMKSKLSLCGLILIVMVVILICNIPNLFFYFESGSCKSSNDITLITDVISILIRTYIPFGVMVVLNFLMIRKLFKSDRLTFKQNSLSRKEYQFTVAVMAYDAYFLFFNFPLSVHYIMFDINLYSGALKGDPAMNAGYNLYSSVAINFSLLVQILSFFMYTAFNKLFRQELLRVFGLTRFFLGSQVSNSTQPTINAAHNTLAAMSTKH